MSKDEKSKRRHVWRVGISALAVALTILAFYNHRPAIATSYDKRLDNNVSAESRVLFTGDVYWGRRMNDWSRQNQLKEAYPFSRLNEFGKNSYDAWVANLECPAVEGIHQPIGFVPQLWEFNCDTDYLPEFSKWVDIVSLANNHTSNQQREDGLQKTRQSLQKNNIQYFGSFNTHTKENCEVISVPARIKTGSGQVEGKLPMAMCGFDGVYYTITNRNLQEIQEYAKYMPVIAFPHAGREYQATADLKLQKLYRKMIDYGADAVIGNHPHWVQPTEAYKGKLITYSLGNFIFDQNFNNEVMRSAALDAVITVTNTLDNKALAAWAALGEACSIFKDTCLQEAAKQNLQKLTVQFKYRIVGVDTSGQITHPADQRLLDEILVRLNWHEVSSKLNQN